MKREDENHIRGKKEEKYTSTRKKTSRETTPKPINKNNKITHTNKNK